MSFEGYLIKIGDRDEYFNSFIEYKSYKAAKKVLDLDSYRDANGELHRFALEHLSYTVKFNIRPLREDEHSELFSFIQSNFIIPQERKLSMKFWVPEIHDYVEANMYMPNTDFTILKIDPISGTLFYDKTEAEFIGY